MVRKVLDFETKLPSNRKCVLDVWLVLPKIC